MLIFLSLKFLEKLAGDSLSTTGAIESFGPPVGCFMLAHCTVSKIRLEKKLKSINLVVKVLLTLFKLVLFIFECRLINEIIILYIALFYIVNIFISTIWYSVFYDMCTIKTLISDGDTPDILEA